MSKTLIDIDDELLAEAQKALGTETKKETVNRALAEAVALVARREYLVRMRNGELGDLELLKDKKAMAAAWRQ